MKIQDISAKIERNLNKITVIGTIVVFIKKISLNTNDKENSRKPIPAGTIKTKKPVSQEKQVANIESNIFSV